MQKWWYSITWVFIWRGSVEEVKSRKNWMRNSERAKNGFLRRYRCTFLSLICVFGICVLQHLLGADQQMACNIVCQIFHFSHCQTNTYTHPNMLKHMYIIHTHAEPYEYPPPKAHLLRILPWERTEPTVYLQLTSWKRSVEKRTISHSERNGTNVPKCIP